MHSILQAIITTNGLYSFTMFTYHQLQWSAGLWGGFPQIGFNAGDQVNYFKLNQSFTSDVVKVVNYSNIGVPGQFVFHTTGNISNVECRSPDGLQALPFRGSMYGGYEFRLSGICFNESNYKVEIAGQEIQNCQITLTYIRCKMPMTIGGRLKITVYNRNRFVAETDFLAVELEPNADLILQNYDELNNGVQSIDDGQFTLRFQSNEITNKYRFRIIAYVYGAQYFMNNGTIYDRTMNRIDLEFDARNLSSLQTLTIKYNSLFLAINQPGDRSYFLTIVFEVVRPSSRILLAAIPLYAIGIFAISATAYTAFCPIWMEFQPNPQTYIDQIPPCPCRVLTTWAENQMGYTVDDACDGRKPAGETCTFHKGATGCYRRKSSTGNAGAQCCYDAQGLWINDPNKGAGTLDAYSPDNSIFLHFFYDVLPYFSCCKALVSPSAEKCKQYMDKRPPGRCENLLPVPSGGNGDPHFTTLNGSSYTFNGYGEYTLIKSTVAQFEVQVRLVLVNVNSSNKCEEKATAIVAFVIKNGNQSRVQFELFPLQKLIQILIDNRAVEYIPLTEEDFKFLSTSPIIYSDDRQLKIRQTSVTSLEITYGESNMQFTVYLRPSFDFLDLVSIIPRDIMEKGKPQGLMGDLDGLAFPNGTRVSLATMNDDQALFAYGESWRTTNNTSLFYYYYQNSHATHQNFNYQPPFPQEIFKKYNGTDRFQMAQNNCRNLTDPQRCLYDVLITNDPTISNMHKQFDANIGTWKKYVEEVKQDIRNDLSSSSSKTGTNSITALFIGLTWLLVIFFIIKQ